MFDFFAAAGVRLENLFRLVRKLRDKENRNE